MNLAWSIKIFTAVNFKSKDQAQYQNIQAVISVSRMEDSYRNMKANGRRGKYYQFLSVSSGILATKRSTCHGGCKAHEKPEKREKRQKKVSVGIYNSKTVGDLNFGDRQIAATSLSSPRCL